MLYASEPMPMAVLICMFRLLLDEPHVIESLKICDTIYTTNRSYVFIPAI